jgi:hypothetical protein
MARIRCNVRLILWRFQGSAEGLERSAAKGLYLMAVPKLIAAILGGVLLIGCQASQDQHTFDSTPHLPTTVSLMDTANNTVFWTMEVPVWCRLKLDFDRESQREKWKVDPTFPATAMRWEMHRKDTKQVVKSGTEKLGGLPLLIRVTYRDRPEIPDDIDSNCLQVASNLRIAAATPPADGAYAPIQVTVNEPRIAAAPAPDALPQSAWESSPAAPVKAQPQSQPLPPAVTAVPVVRQTPRTDPQQPVVATEAPPQPPIVMQPQVRVDAPVEEAAAVEPSVTSQLTSPSNPPQVADGRRAIPLHVHTELLQKYDAATVAILIEGVPSNAQLSAGRDNGSGIWTLNGDQTQALTMYVPPQTNQDIQLMIIATAPMPDGDTASTVSNLIVRIDPMAAAR